MCLQMVPDAFSILRHCTEVYRLEGNICIHGLIRLKGHILG